MNKNIDLFGQPIDGISPIRIVQQPNKASLSKAQTTFNTLITQIENKRNQFIAWEKSASIFQQKIMLELTPLLEQSINLKIEIVLALERVREQKGFSKFEAELIETLMLDYAETVLADRNDERIKAIYDRYHAVSYDQQKAAELAQMKTIIESATGFELDDEIDMSNPEAVLQHIQDQILEQAAAEEIQRASQADRRAGQKKSAKQLAKEQKLRDEAQHISRSLREIYRKLASTLHPDRETDPEERARKTALMQRANQAYEDDNLLQLLELQLELECITPDAINNLDEERLQRYNSMLKVQLKELNEEIAQFKNEFCMRFGLDPSIKHTIKLTPASVLRLLTEDIVSTENDIELFESDLAALQSIKSTKIWLKMMQRMNYC